MVSQITCSSPPLPCDIGTCPPACFRPLPLQHIECKDAVRLSEAYDLGGLMTQQPNADSWFGPISFMDPLRAFLRASWAKDEYVAALRLEELFGLRGTVLAHEQVSVCPDAYAPPLLANHSVRLDLCQVANSQEVS